MGVALVIWAGPIGVKVGWGLISSGVSHFGTAFAIYNDNKAAGWDAASNYAGFSSPTISINVDSWFGGGKSDKNGINQSEPVVKPETIAKDDVRNMSADAGGNCCGGNNWATATLGFIATDTMIPDPTDVAWPKWAGYAIAGTAAASYLYSGDYIAKMNREIDGIRERTLGPPGYQYALTATHSGYYPNVRGGTTYLNTGDVWKYGETTKGDGRYTKDFYNGMGLRMDPQFYGNQMQIKIQEKIMIYNYYFANGTLPPGNKIFR